MATDKHGDVEASHQDASSSLPSSFRSDAEERAGSSGMRAGTHGAMNDSMAIGDRNASVTEATILRNPLAGMTQEELFADVSIFAKDKGLEDIEDELRRGAVIAQDGKNFERMTDLSEVDKTVLRREKTHRWLSVLDDVLHDKCGSFHQNQQNYADLDSSLRRVRHRARDGPVCS